MSTPVAERLRAAPAIEAALAARTEMGEGGAWVVGGAIRDALLGRAVKDVDLAVRGEPARAAKALARACGGHAFELSAEFRTWRVAGPKGAEGDRERWVCDVTALRGSGIAEDLGLRDFTINAIAVDLGELATAGGKLVDPHGGEADLERDLVRAVSKRSFTDDPLRIMRAARIAAGLGLSIEPDTAALAIAESERSGEPSPERRFAELRGMVAGPDPIRGIELLSELRGLAGTLPELDGLRGVVQNANHHLDVWEHTLEVLERLLAIEADLEAYAGEHAEALAAHLARPLADELTHADALRLGALLHDIGKPATRMEHEGGSFVTFIGHDSVGAEMIETLCSRLRTSRRLSAHLQGLARHHLRVGFLTHRMPLGPREVHDYLRATEPVGPDVTLLTVADRLAARGSGATASEEMVGNHLTLARELLGAALAWQREGPPPPPIAGDELADLIGIEPGPELGRVLRELEAAQYAGEVRDREDAIRIASRLVSAADG